MMRRFVFGVFVIAAIAVAFQFGNIVSAQKETSDALGDDRAGQQEDAPEVSTSLVISQLYGAGGNTGATYNIDYVEIKNISSTAQTTNGLALQYGSATGQFGGTNGTNIVPLPDGSIAPGKYFLVSLGTAGANGGPLPVAADFNSPIINMSGSSGKIALTTNATHLNCGGVAPGTACVFPNSAIIDWVAYGAAGNVTAGNGEGGTSVNNGTALTNTQGGVRKTDGCTETDNNNADFDAVTAPVPRNAATAAAPCSGGGGPAVGPKLFNARLNGANENPANATTGSGYGRVILNAAETQVSVSVYWNGLTGNATAGHIHGPAASTANGPVILNLAPSAAATGSVVNSSFAVTPTQVADLKAGLWYFNIHTAANPGGEIRGQIGKNTPRFDTDGDGDSDYGIVRPGSGGAGGVTTWYTSLNSGTPNDPHTINQWGTNADVITPGDFDGDGKDDIAFWRPTGVAAFFILRSSTGTLQQVNFGVQGDDPTIVGDYSGDGKDDPAIYRAGATASSQSFFWHLASSGPLQGVQVVQAWGAGSDFAVPGDFDGDGRHDLVVARNIGGANTFIMFSSQSQVSYTSFGIGGGLSPDRAVPGDYDGDGRTDFAITRNEGGSIAWWYRPSTGGSDVRVAWGVSGSDIEAQGDYDGNGTTDPAIWRPAGGSKFFALTGPSTVRFQTWGLPTDQPSIYDLHGE